jgi:hypothetical protein|tara:strand:- start:679 stop:1203 length:525 start_codon:yes stop_codon:yes gene_type:complete
MATRVCAGEHDSLGYGLYVSKIGKNAQTATDLDLIFNSETTYGSGQIHQIIDITCGTTAPLYEGTGTIVGLAYIPFVHIIQYGGSGVKGIKSWWGRSSGGGSGASGGKSQLKWSEWRAKVTNTQITIQSWSGATVDGNYSYISGIHNAAYSLQWPSNTSGDTFRCFVYKIPATA